MKNNKHLGFNFWQFSDFNIIEWGLLVSDEVTCGGIFCSQNKCYSASSLSKWPSNYSLFTKILTYVLIELSRNIWFTILCIIKNIFTAENILWHHKDSASIWQFLSVSTLQMTYVSNFMNFHEVLKIRGTICMIVSAFLASPRPGVILGETWFFCFVIFGFWKTWLTLHILNMFELV